ncbi:MAG: transketolase [Melioribacteraceae bacterium]|nr:transketolase [Melioribacteraceae bacterium]
MNELDLNLAKLASNTIRVLSAEGVQKANSGHPGMPMGMADCAFVLWNQFLKFNPSQPDWSNRDRFVLSPGHGSMLMYSLLHLYGYDISIDDLKNFRQLGSKTAGHPEYGEVKGIETTTGPLGQGFVNGIGMAIGAKMTAARFNTEEHKIFGTHKVYAICSDGDLMEGLSSEAASLAGHLKLNNLIYLYDDNNITIEGSTDLAFTESIEKRFDAFNWETKVIDGHDYTAINNAIEEAKTNQTKPILIICKTTIGKGSPNKKNTSGVHGSPLGLDELKLTKENLGFPTDKEFYVPEEVSAETKKSVEKKIKEFEVWNILFEEWKSKNSELAKEYEKFVSGVIPENLEEELLSVLPDSVKATRALSGMVMQKIAELIPGFVGGSADLKPSTNTYLDAYESIQSDSFGGRNFHYGIREHAMGSINNGLALYSSFIPFGATFMVFADYMRPAVRLAALMKLKQIFIFTHDSVFVGEDGPTHQPVEHLASLRIIPNLLVLRPADGIETALCWSMAIRNENGPSTLLLTRQGVKPIVRENEFSNSDVAKGGYLIRKEKADAAKVAILASGSEVNTALDAQEILEAKGISTRVISVPCKEFFDKQSDEYKRGLIPVSVERTAVVEAGISFGWERYFDIPQVRVTIDEYGASGPYEELAEKYCLTGEKVAEKIISSL